MIVGMYAVFDTKAGAYMPPFFMHNHAMAQRAIMGATMDKEHQFYKHPEDYTLHYLGEFDDNTGYLTQEEPLPIVNCVQLKMKIVEQEMVEQEITS